jgi:hypothetical protein
VNEYTNGWNINYDNKSMGNPSASTLDAAKHTNVVTNTWTQWGNESTNPSVVTDDAKANSLGDHPSTVTYGFTVKTLVAAANILSET